MSQVLSDESIARLKKKITHRCRVNLHMEYLSYEEIKERDDWCEENIRRSWKKAKTISNEWMWCFCHEMDAAAFKLRWF